MNQVPWRRILERAGDTGDEAPGERGASVINLRDHAPDRQNRRRPVEPESSDLESELKRALDRAQRSERELEALRGPPPRNSARTAAPEPRSAPMLRPDLAMQRQVGLPLPPPKKKASGARNFLAVSLSTAVIGFAIYQIGGQWEDMSNGPEAANSSADIPESFTAVVASGSGIRVSTPDRPSAGQPRTEFEGNRINLRPSFAEEAGTPPVPAPAHTKRETALDRDIAEAAQLFAQGSPKQRAAVPTAAPAATTTEGMEQIMLRRGHDMMKQGRVESARLIFEHLAGQNSALGAFALAETYDAKHLRERGITDATPDQKLAAQWYQRAAELTMAATR
jgi:hypothetical protein